MDIRRVDENFAVASQVQAGDMQALADAGFTDIMCNRPDGEEPGQPPLSELRAAAEAAGLVFHHVPVAGGMFPPEALAECLRRPAVARPLSADYPELRRELLQENG